MENETKIVRRTVGERIDERGYLSVHFYATELEQFVSRGVLKRGDKVRDMHDLVCKQYGISPRTGNATGGAVKMVKEKLNLTATQLARKVLENPELLAQIKKQVESGKIQIKEPVAQKQSTKAIVKK